MAHFTPPGPPLEATTRGFFGVFRYSRRAIELVWVTNGRLTVVLAVLTLVAGVLPAAMAYVGALIIDAVLAATRVAEDSGDISMTRVFTLVAIEALIVAAISGAQRGISLCQALLRAQLGQRVNVMILEKATHAGTGAVRGFRVLRQADPCPARGFQPAIVAGQSHLWSWSESDLVIQLRCAAGAVLTMGGVDTGAGRPAVIRGGNTFFGRGLHPVPLALTRDPHADIPRDRDRT